MVMMMGATLGVGREGLLTRPCKNGQQASIHIDIDAGVVKVVFRKESHFKSFRDITMTGEFPILF